jgi:hypothetical protein
MVDNQYFYSGVHKFSKNLGVPEKSRLERGEMKDVQY